MRRLRPVGEIRDRVVLVDEGSAHGRNIGIGRRDCIPRESMSAARRQAAWRRGPVRLARG
jgi:hypothetical protein